MARRTAKEKAASTASAFIMHWIWIRRSVKIQVQGELEDKWEAISSEIDSDAKPRAVQARFAEYLDSLSIEEIKKWSKRIAEGAAVGLLVDQIKKFLGL